jgi:hypothetical protein
MHNLIKMTIKTSKNPNLLLNKLGLVLLLLIASISTSCSHLFFEEIQPKGGELQNAFPSKIQGDYSKWCYTNSEGEEVCYNQKELMATDSVSLKRLITKDSVLINALFLKVDNKTVTIQSLMFNEINGVHTLDKDVYLSRIDPFYVLNFKVDAKNYTKPNGKTLNTDLFECFAMELDSSGYVQIYYINSTSILNKTKRIIPVGSGSESYVSKKPITAKNIAKIIYSEPLTFFQLDLGKNTITGPLIDELAGIECEPTERQYNKSLRKEKRALKKSN